MCSLLKVFGQRNPDSNVRVILTKTYSYHITEKERCIGKKEGANYD